MDQELNQIHFETKYKLHFENHILYYLTRIRSVLVSMISFNTSLKVIPKSSKGT